jgi:hypothetical protein
MRKRQPSQRISRTVSTKTIAAKSRTDGRLDLARDQFSAFWTAVPWVSLRRRVLRRLERIRQQRVIYDAQKQTTYRPHENATYRARVYDADAGAAYDASGRKGNEDAATETTANKDGSGPRRESENNAGQLPTEAAGCPKALNAGLISGINFLIKVAKVRQSLHRQAVFVFFALNVQFHQMFGKAFTGALRLGTVCKSAIYDQRAING